MNVTLSNTVQLPIVVRDGAEVGHIRTLRRELDEIGVTSTFSLAVNGVGVEDSHILQEGDVISFRPLTGTKGTK